MIRRALSAALLAACLAGTALAQAPPAAVVCESCHEGTYRQDLDASPHAGLGCRDCHASVKDGPHSEKPADVNCGACHGDQASKWRASAHGLAVLQKGLDVAPSCSGCHGTHAIGASKGTPEAKRKLRAAEICGKCHGPVLEAYRRGIHSRALEQGKVQAPACTDCHGEHGILGSAERGSTVAPAAVVLTCGKCHGDKQVMASFSIPSDRVSTFRESVHGAALDTGLLKAANCASCHGSHDVLPSSDPSSRTNPANLEKTCGTCHPGAGKGFASARIHVTVSPEGVRGAWWVRVFYTVFTSVLVGGFLLHILAEAVGRLRERKARRAGGILG